MPVRLLRVGEAGRETAVRITRGRHRRGRVLAGRRLRRRLPRRRWRRAAARPLPSRPTCPWSTSTPSGSGRASRGRPRWCASASTTPTTPRSPASRCRQEPVVFFKAPNTVVGPYDDVRIPRASEKTDWEVELGDRRSARPRLPPRRGRGADIDRRLRVSHDVSERAFQLERGGQWVKGKSCETFNPLGPWLVTPDEVDDVQELALSLTRQRRDHAVRGRTADMIFSAAHVVLVPQPVHGPRARRPHQHRVRRRASAWPGSSTCRPATSTELEVEGLGRQRQRFVPAP